MTRENKFALVVGFGLVLLVGILISDHLASARSPDPPDLIPAGATENAAALDFGFVDLGGRGDGALGPEPASEKAPTAPRTRPPAETVPPVEQPETPQPVPLTQANDAVHPESGDKVHTINPGETLAAISRRYYGKESMAVALAKYNGLDNPDHVVAGQSLRIPPIQAIETARPAASKAEAPTRGTPTYTVKPDETLSEIAQRVLGTARRWEELFELNRSILSDPNAIRAGMELRLPENP